METPTEMTCTEPKNTQAHGLGMAPLVLLLEQIVFFNDEQALRELHDRRTPCRWNGEHVSLFEYIQALSRTAMVWRRVGGNQEALEDALALTVEKLTNVPESDPDRSPLKSHGPDRRVLYREVLRDVVEVRAEHPDLDPFELEDVVASMLQKAAARALRFSCLEAKRSRNPLRTRYAWWLGEKALNLWMPVSMSGVGRRAWLEANVDDPDPYRPQERERVQAIVDARLGVPRHVELDHAAAGSRPRSAGGPVQTLIQREIGVRGMAAVVAEEKADNIDRLRPSIQMMGPGPLEAIIHRVFRELGEGSFEAKTVAESFGLSEPTLSRFVGVKRSRPQGFRLPDLWRNVAALLRAGCPVFVQAVEQAGLRPQMEAFLRDYFATDAGRNAHAR